MFTVAVDVSNIQGKLAGLQRAIPEVKQRILNELSQYAFNTYREQVPVAKPRPGRENVGGLRESITLVRKPDGFTVFPTAYYAPYVAYGTRPHIISAKWKSKLKFFWEKIGTWFITPQVFHPGQKRNPFHVRVYRLIYNKMNEILHRSIQDLMCRTPKTHYLVGIMSR
jgi:hypothetical protein